MAGRPRQTLAHAITSGAIKTNPGRFVERALQPPPECPLELGEAPRHLSKNQKNIWNEMASQAAPGVLRSADRLTLEIACVLMDKWREPRQRVVTTTKTLKNGDTTVTKVESFDIMQTSELAQLSNLLGKLGFNPIDRAKIKAPEGAQPENDPWAELTRM
jgi:P27 family predicted phage terminase small subunit